jgi:hypothetical protein
VAGLLGSLPAFEVLRYLTGFEPPADAGTTLQTDFPRLPDILARLAAPSGMPNLYKRTGQLSRRTRTTSSGGGDQ